MSQEADIAQFLSGALGVLRHAEVKLNSFCSQKTLSQAEASFAQASCF